MTESELLRLVTGTLGRLETKVDGLARSLGEKADKADISRLYTRLEDLERGEHERAAEARTRVTRREIVRDRLLVVTAALSTVAFYLALVHP